MAMQQVQQLFLQAPMHKMSARDLGPSHMKEVRSHQSLASLDEDSADFDDEPTSAAKISSSTDFAELLGAAAPGKMVALGAAPRLMEAANMKAAAADEGLLRPMELLQKAATTKVVAGDDGPLRPMMLMGAFDVGFGVGNLLHLDEEPSGKPRARRGGNLQYAIEDEESFCGLQ